MKLQQLIKRIWARNKINKNLENGNLKIAERRVIRAILGPNVTGDGEGLKSKKELEVILLGENLVKHIKALRLEWLGHIMR